jgi:predicted MFS family arabinose efflux permease
LGAWFSGLLADRFTMAFVFQVTSLLCFIGGLTAFGIDRDQPREVVIKKKPDLI